MNLAEKYNVSVGTKRDGAWDIMNISHKGYIHLSYFKQARVCLCVCRYLFAQVVLYVFLWHDEFK